MKLTLEVKINSRDKDDLDILTQLIKEGWVIENIWSIIDEQNKNFKFDLVRK